MLRSSISVDVSSFHSSVEYRVLDVRLKGRVNGTRMTRIQLVFADKIRKDQRQSPQPRNPRSINPNFEMKSALVMLCHKILEFPGKESHWIVDFFAERTSENAIRHYNARFYLHSRHRCWVVPLRTYWRSGGIAHLVITQNFSPTLGFFRLTSARFLPPYQRSASSASPTLGFFRRVAA